MAIANNHLSKAAQFGRFGDDSMRFVDGEMSHVNSGEAKLIDVLGQRGEDMVQESGSGTTNPITGMKEYFDPFTIATGVLAVGSAISSSRIQKNQWESGKEAAEQGLKDIRTSENQLDKLRTSRMQIAGLEHGKQLKDLSTETGISMDELNKSTNQAISKSNLAFSGDVVDQKTEMWDRLKTSYGSSKEGLMSSLGKSMGEITSFYEGEKSRLKNEKSKLSREIKLYDTQLGGWFG